MEVADQKRNFDHQNKKHGGFSSGIEDGDRRGFADRRRFEGGDNNHRYGNRTVFRGGGGGRYASDRQPRRRSQSDGSYMDSKNSGGYRKPYDTYAQNQNHSSGNGYYPARNNASYSQRYRRNNGEDRFSNGRQYAVNGQMGTMDDNPGANSGNQYAMPGRRRRDGWTRRRFGGFRRGADDRSRRRTRSEGREAAATKLRDRATDDEAEPQDEATDEQKPKSYTTMPPEDLPDGLFTVKILNVPKEKSILGLYNFMACFGRVTNLHVLPPVEHKVKKGRNDRRKSPKSGTEVVQSSENEAEAKKETEKTGEEVQDGGTASDGEQKKVESSRADDDAVADAKSGSEQDAGKDDADQYDVVENYVAYVTFENPESANKAIRLNNRITFGNRIKVHRYSGYQRVATSERRRRASHKTGFGSLDEKLLTKMFETMDLRTRGQAQLVCHQWNRAMRQVKMPAPDCPPGGVAMVLRSSLRNVNQRERVKVEFDKSTNTVTLISSHNRSVDEMCRRATRVGASLGGVTSLRVSHLEIGRGVLGVVELLGDSSRGDFSVAFQACWSAPGVPFGRVVSMVRRLGDRLTVEDAAPPLPPEKSSAPKKSSAAEVAVEQEAETTEKK